MDKKLKDNSLSSTKEYLREVILPALFYCLVAGVLTGLLISVYSYCANLIYNSSTKIYALVQANLAYVPLLFLCLVILGLVSAFLIKKIPEVRGSGIPRTEGILRGLLTFKWLRVILGTLIGSFLSFFGGLSLGNEGPSVQLGAATAEGANSLLRSKYAWRRYVSTGGAAAGIGVAFGAPITGIMFAIEEVHKQFNPLLLLSVVTTSLFAKLTSDVMRLALGNDGLFFGFIGEIKNLGIANVWMLLILAIVLGLCAVGFNYLLLKKPLVKPDGKYVVYVRVVAAFVLSGAAGLILIDSLGSGYGLIKKVATLNVGWQMMIAFLVLKLLLITLGYRSGATGGLFLPMLTLGALIGGLMGKLLILMGLGEEYFTTIVMISMASFMGAAIRAPFTSLILLVETTPSTFGFMSAAIVIFVSCIVAEVCMRKPLYDRLLDREIEDFNKDKILVLSTFDKAVEVNSFVEKKYIRNVLWPSNCKITTILRGNDTIVPDGKTLLYAGDILHISYENYNVDEAERQIDNLLMNKHQRKNV